MHEYYLFHIKHDIYQLYKKNCYPLYQTLKNIYHLKAEDLNYGRNLYRQLCVTFNLKIVNEYLDKRYYLIYYKKNMYYFINSYTKEKTLVKVGYSRIYIKSNVNLPKIIEIFKFYNQKIFVCNFKTGDYFWLTK